VEDAKDGSQKPERTLEADPTSVPRVSFQAAIKLKSIKSKHQKLASDQYNHQPRLESLAKDVVF
jgi:hypothetical protein